MPALDLAITVLMRKHRAHPRRPPPPARPRPPAAPGAWSAIPECRSGSPPETTPTAPRPEHSSAPPSAEDARARSACDAPPPAGSHARSFSAHPTSRSRPSLPITGLLTPAWPTPHALWQTDWAGLVEFEKVAGQPGQARHRPADYADQYPAPADAVPARPP